MNKYEIKTSIILAILYGDNFNVKGISRDGEVSINTTKKYMPEIKETLQEAFHFWQVYKDLRSYEETQYTNYAYNKIMRKKHKKAQDFIEQAQEEAKKGKYDMKLRKEAEKWADNVEVE